MPLDGGSKRFESVVWVKKVFLCSIAVAAPVL